MWRKIPDKDNIVEEAQQPHENERDWRKRIGRPNRRKID
jgi:hypothetical protein